MKLNSNIRIISNKTILVPYEKHHVQRYHEWMKSEELQMLTASEPLTLEKEYDMQVTWREDEDKCTFIILDKEIYNNTRSEIESMIGDTNIFIYNFDSKCTGEIEIMIAEKTFRGKKYGWESAIVMLLYGIKHIKIDNFEAKISMDNTPSIHMFKRLGFVEKSQSEVFKEITLEKSCDQFWVSWLENEVLFEIKSM